MANNLIETIKSLNIVEVIQNYLHLEKKGANFWGICPFHNDSNASLSVNEQRQMFKCFTCNVAGDAISFVSKLKNISYIEAALQIAKDFHLDQKLIEDFSNHHSYDKELEKLYQLNKDYLDLSQTMLNQKDSMGMKYLVSRHLDKDVIEHFGIGYCDNKFPNEMYKILTNENNFLQNANPDKIYTRQEMLDNGLISITPDGNILDYFRGRVIFSIKNEFDQIVGFSGRIINKNSNEPKYLNTSETRLFHKGKILYHWSDVKKIPNLTNVYLVEGFMDVIALYKANIPNAVACMGVALGDYQIQLLKNNTIENVILAYDNDEAGLNATIKNGLLIAKYFNTFVVKPYENAKDFDELLNSTNKEHVNKVANNIEHFSIYYLKYLINSFNLQNDVAKQTFLTEAIAFLKNYSNKLYYNEYLNLIKEITGYDLDILKEELSFVKEEKINKFIKSSNVKNQDYKRSKNFEKRYQFNSFVINKKRVTKPNNLNTIDLNKSMRRAQLSLIRYLLLDKQMLDVIDEYLAVKKTDEFKYLYNILLEWYEEVNLSENYLNHRNLDKFIRFMDDYGYDLSYLNIIKKMINYNLSKEAKFDLLDASKAVVQANIWTLKLELKNLEAKIINSSNDFNDLDASELSNLCQTLNKNNNLIKQMNSYEFFKQDK